MTDNRCGNCTACCRVYAIPEFDKPAGKWCEHCDIGKGCRIYETRPPRCVSFECMWLQSQHRSPSPFGPELRPDKCKVVFAPSTNEKVMTAITMPGSPFAWQRKDVMRLIERLNKTGISVAVSSPGALRHLLIKPDGSRHDVMMTEPDEDGMQWNIDRV